MRECEWFLGDDKLNIKISRKNAIARIKGFFILLTTCACLLVFVTSTANDVDQYILISERLRGTNFIESFILLRYEIGGLFLIWMLANYVSGLAMVYITGIIAAWIKYVLFTRFILLPNFAFLIYLVTFAHIVDANQIRSALALCVVFYALFAEPRSKYGYLLLAIFAMLFHYSGIIILCFYFVNRPVVITLLIIIGGLAFEYLLSVIPILEFALIWRASENGGVNLTNSLFLMQSIITIACLVDWNKLTEGQKRGALLCLFGVVTYLMFLNNPIVAHRFRELSQIGIFAILFLGGRGFSEVKIITSLCLVYIVSYNLSLILTELSLVYNVSLF